MTSQTDDPQTRGLQIEEKRFSIAPNAKNDRFKRREDEIERATFIIVNIHSLFVHCTTAAHATQSIYNSFTLGRLFSPLKCKQTSRVCDSQSGENSFALKAINPSLSTTLFVCHPHRHWPPSPHGKPHTINEKCTKSKNNVMKHKIIRSTEHSHTMARSRESHNFPCC